MASAIKNEYSIQLNYGETTHTFVLNYDTYNSLYFKKIARKIKLSFLF